MPHALIHIAFVKHWLHLGKNFARTPEEFKSWSQNIGHEDVLTTLYSYGEVQQHRQGEIIQQLKSPRQSGKQNINEIVRATILEMNNQNTS